MALMLRTFLTRQSATPGRAMQLRNICKSPARLEKPAAPAKEAESTGDGSRSMGPLIFNVKTYQKYALVWTGKYKSVAEVPDKLPQGEMKPCEVPERVAEMLKHSNKVLRHSVLDVALNKARVKISIYMMGMTVVACFAFVYAGKKMAKEGDSLAQRTIDHHAQLREEALREREASSTK